MKGLSIYKVTGTVVGILLIGSTALSIRQRQRDHLAGALLQEIQERIKPIASGLISQNAFNVHYLDAILQAVQGEVLTLKSQAAAYYAKQIHKAWGNWYKGGDDEAMVYGVFRNLKDKVQVSQVAKAYQEDFGKSLIDAIKSNLNKEEITIILTIIKALPNYRTS